MSSREKYTIVSESTTQELLWVSSSFEMWVHCSLGVYLFSLFNHPLGYKTCLLTRVTVKFSQKILTVKKKIQKYILRSPTSVINSIYWWENRHKYNLNDISKTSVFRSKRNGHCSLKGYILNHTGLTKVYYIFKQVLVEVWINHTQASVESKDMFLLNKSTHTQSKERKKQQQNKNTWNYL